MINFMRFRYFYFAFSLLFIILSVFGLVFWGLKPSVEFTGGTQIKFEILNFKFEIEEIINLTKESGIEVSNLTNETNSSNSYILRAKEISQDKYSEFQKKIIDAGGEYKEISFESVGPVVGKELVFKTIIAVVLGSLFILFYVARQFKNPMFGVCAILAMFHDSIILLGVFSFLGHFRGVEIDVLFVTAVLTILSFSVHDTIVVYDRVRESIKTTKGISFVDLVNKAVTETLSRSFNNSMTIIFMLLTLFFLGGDSIKWFVLALLVGTISGTYSSTFTAAPLLVIWNELKKRK
ncbi:protein translocase subunit SecF [candidate division WWE3 bacterium CG08_land_8_20_14_0_20_40_13]|uniref:Protein-export membrane protein SecF n=1 Tax=candidate division WWE3 bacterium CG08_land_8_20_14_0_20_40_13 TaxID=1975084 RepID=A0A2H0XEK9_UNCKA|nr:MAG: protein translocase subunit SecF [candidate division WWE3 bacterium CG08_land_8_20_14_0_20_40_13]